MADIETGFFQTGANRKNGLSHKKAVLRRDLVHY
jgi:hypothetical protein